MDNKINLPKSEIKNILSIIKTKNKKFFRFYSRDIDTLKDPKVYMVELGIDYDDAIEYIKSLTIDDYVECILDKKHNYKYLYVLKKIINNNLIYIKIGFLYDIKTGNVDVVSFHKDMWG